MTFGQKLLTAFKGEAARVGRKLTDAEIVAIADQAAQLEGVTKRRAPKGTVRARNPLFDALATATGTKNLAELTRAGARAVAIALQDIKAVSPDVTVDEIQRRAAAYKARHPSWVLTAGALAKHWGEFGAKHVQVPMEGPAGWRDRLNAKHPGNTFAGTWNTLPESMQREVAL